MLKYLTILLIGINVFALTITQGPKYVNGHYEVSKKVKKGVVDSPKEEFVYFEINIKNKKLSDRALKNIAKDEAKEIYEYWTKNNKSITHKNRGWFWQKVDGNSYLILGAVAKSGKWSHIVIKNRVDKNEMIFKCGDDWSRLLDKQDKNCRITIGDKLLSVKLFNPANSTGWKSTDIAYRLP